MQMTSQLGATSAHTHTSTATGGQITDAALSTAVTVAKGGTGLTAGTSGGVPYFNATSTMASWAALTANLPVIGGGAGAAPAVGTRSGNTTAYVTTTGTQTRLGGAWRLTPMAMIFAAAAACGTGAAPVTPIRPYSAIPVTAGSVYGCIIDGDEMLCMADTTTAGADATWQLGFEMPPDVGHRLTYKLQLDGKANATSGAIRINPAWNTWAPGVTRASLTLNPETVIPDSVTGAAGSGDTVTWGAGDSNQLIRAKWTLNASTVTAGQRIAMNLVFENTSHTLAVQSGWIPFDNL